MRYEKLELKKNYSQEPIDGIVLFENKEFVQILIERDFQFEGYQVIAKQAIQKRIKQAKSLPITHYLPVLAGVGLG